MNNRSILEQSGNKGEDDGDVGFSRGFIYEVRADIEGCLRRWDRVAKVTSRARENTNCA